MIKYLEKTGNREKYIKLKVPVTERHPAYEVTVQLCTCQDSHDYVGLNVRYQGIVAFECVSCHHIIEGCIWQEELKKTEKAS